MSEEAIVNEPEQEQEVRARAAFEVNAGVIPLEPIAEHRKIFFYSEDDYIKDQATPEDEPTIYSKLSQEAHEYARSLENPAYLNWAQVTFLWF